MFNSKPSYNPFLTNTNNTTNNDNNTPFSFLNKNNNQSQGYNPFMKNALDSNTNNSLNFSFS